MSISKKYGRTYHYPFSPGTTSDDRINHEWESDIAKIKEVVHTEKMDGENTCLKGVGVFARSHAAPTRHPWSSHLKQKFSTIQEDLKKTDTEIFGENMYAQHSIIYPKLEHHFYVFAIRHLDMWLSWDEVKWYADFYDYPVVPDIGRQYASRCDSKLIKECVLSIIPEPSKFGSTNQNGDECTMEGIVTRNVDEYKVEDFKQNVFKYVRKNHVSTDVHWTRNWKRAPLLWEKIK